tara:strand:- start:51 stop:470 length:420 start_codon:yes stop_codon:yes gene_type:complete
MSKEYEVGKLVYLMCAKNFSIVPALIVEEVVRKTLDKVDISYMINKAGSKEVVDLSEVKQDVFTDIEAVRQFMYENTRKSVDRMVEVALQKEKEHFSDYNTTNIDIDVANKHVQNNNNDVIINTVKQDNLQVTNNIEEQ